MKPKILVITEMFPSKLNLIRGSYIKEQIQLLSADFDTRVIVGSFTQIGRKEAIRSFLKRIPMLVLQDNSPHYDQTIHTAAMQIRWVKLLPKRIEQMQYSYISKQISETLNQTILNAWKPDLIHIQGVSVSSIFLTEYAEQNNIPIIITEHSAYVFDSSGFWGTRYINLYNRVDKVLFVSHHLLRHFLLHHYDFKSQSIIGNFVDDSIVHQEKVKFENLKLLFVASHPSCKDIPTFLEAIQILIQLLPDIRVNMVGFEEDSYMGIEVKKQISVLGLEAYIDFKGPIPHAEMHAIYRDNSILVSTSFSETFGLSVAEAILNGLPVVCTDSGGVREFVNESNGIIVPIREPKLIALAIVDIVNNIKQFDAAQMYRQMSESYGALAFAEKIRMEYTQMLAIKR